MASRVAFMWGRGGTWVKVSVARSQQLQLGFNMERGRGGFSLCLSIFLQVFM
jgi:hypothetical protein